MKKCVGLYLICDLVSGVRLPQKVLLVTVSEDWPCGCKYYRHAFDSPKPAQVVQSDRWRKCLGWLRKHFPIACMAGSPTAPPITRSAAHNKRRSIELQLPRSLGTQGMPQCSPTQCSRAASLVERILGEFAAQLFECRLERAPVWYVESLHAPEFTSSPEFAGVAAT